MITIGHRAIIIEYKTKVSLDKYLIREIVFFDLHHKCHRVNMIESSNNYISCKLNRVRMMVLSHNLGKYDSKLCQIVWIILRSGLDSYREANGGLKHF